jgi:hypothetical protein
MPGLEAAAASVYRRPANDNTAPLTIWLRRWAPVLILALTAAALVGLAIR